LQRLTAETSCCWSANIKHSAREMWAAFGSSSFAQAFHRFEASEKDYDAS
jgi:hypothetical protein